MKSRSWPLPALAFLAAIQASCSQSDPVSSPAAISARLANAGPRNDWPPALGGVLALVQVQDARLLRVAEAWADLCPDSGEPCPEPGQPVFAALSEIQSEALSILGHAAELERLAGGSQPPDPAQPPDPQIPPDPCFVPPSPIVEGDRAYPPDPCLAGVLGSIGHVLAVADARLAGVTDLCPDSGDLCPDSGRVALANIKAAAMSLAETAAELAALMLK